VHVRRAHLVSRLGGYCARAGLMCSMVCLQALLAGRHPQAPVPRSSAMIGRFQDLLLRPTFSLFLWLRPFLLISLAALVRSGCGSAYTRNCERLVRLRARAREAPSDEQPARAGRFDGTGT